MEDKENLKGSIPKKLFEFFQNSKIESSSNKKKKMSFANLLILFSLLINDFEEVDIMVSEIINEITQLKEKLNNELIYEKVISMMGFFVL